MKKKKFSWKKTIQSLAVIVVMFLGWYYLYKSKDSALLASPAFTSGTITDYRGESGAISAPKIGVNKPYVGSSISFQYILGADTLSSDQTSTPGLSSLHPWDTLALKTNYLVIYNEDHPEQSRLLLKIPFTSEIRAMREEELLTLVKEEYELE